MPLRLEILVETAVPESAEEALITAAQAVVNQLRPGETELTILLTDDEAIRELNREFRALDEATDVLSFPAGDEPEDVGNGRTYLGDIAFSVPFARRQAAAGGHGTVAELQLLAVHGILHLLGYDHEHAEDKAVMWALQQALLEELGLDDITPTELDHE